MYLSIAIIRAIVEELEHQGVAPEQFCARAGLDPAELADAALRLPMERGTRVVATAVELTRAPAIGLHVGARAPIGSLHVVGHLIKTPATTREAIELFLRYSALVFEGGGFRFEEAGAQARFAYVHPFPGSRLERFAAECALAFFLRLGLQLTGADNRPAEVCFRHERPDYLDENQRPFRCPIAFGQPANLILFDRRLLDVQQLHRDESLGELLRARADHLLAHEQASERLV